MTTKMTPLRLGATALALVTLAPLACSDATDVALLEIKGSGVVGGQVFLDLDGSGGLTVADTPIVAIDVLLETGTGEVVQQVSTDSLGVFVLEDVPVGSYRLTLDPAALGDSLDILGAGDPVSVALGDTTILDVAVTFDVLSLEEALAAPLGQRVFASGIALNSRVNFGDGQVHFAGESAYLRALNVERSPLQPGDSVRILGRVVTDNGRPALEGVTPYVLVQAAALVVPVDVSVAAAASADGGSLDAGLGRIRDAEITDTSTNANGHFRFWAVDGADSVEVVIRDFLGVNTDVFRPDTIIRLDRLTGLLSPFDEGAGAIRWRMLPRSGGDVSLETKTADVSVSVRLDTTEATLGDTVEVTVVAANAGPVKATLLEVRDTIPDALTYVSSTQTVGSYDSGTGIWDIGEMAIGASDTLRVRMEVTDGTPASINVIGESLGLTFEQDPNGLNNGAVAVLTIS